VVEKSRNTLEHLHSPPSYSARRWPFLRHKGERGLCMGDGVFGFLIILEWNNIISQLDYERDLSERTRLYKIFAIGWPGLGCPRCYIIYHFSKKKVHAVDRPERKWIKNKIIKQLMVKVETKSNKDLSTSGISGISVFELRRGKSTKARQIDRLLSRY
jgi:hypothetical protein